MPMLTIHLQGEGAWSDVDKATIIEARDNAARVALLRGGMTSGKASVGVLIDMKDGTHIFWQTSAALFINAAKAMEAAIAEGNRQAGN